MVLKKKFNFKVSTLVFTHFHGEIPEGFVIDHINCSKTDDYSTNLQVITNSENVRRSYDFSLKGFTFGEMNGVSKLSIPDILSIRKLYEGGGYSQLQLADMFSTSQGHVGGIIRGERWSWLNSCYIAKVKELGLRLVCDIHVENDESYITESNYINHNTGRFSSRNPSFQTMPRTTTSSEVKRQFIAPEDHFFVEIDGCIPGDVRVATTLGMERMDTINSSSSVVLKSETWRVDKAWPTGVKPIFEITTETGRVVRATHNHPFKVKGGFERLENLGPGDVIIRDRSIVSGTFLDLDESYLAGLFYGDGFYSQNLSPNRKINSYRIGFSAGFDREEYKKEILKVFPNQFIQEATPEPHAIYVQDKTLYYSWSSKYPKYSSHEMRIPEAIWLSGEESKLSFIGGAIDSDGSVNANRIRYTSVCKKYIQDLALLGDSVGVYGVIETQGKGGFKNSSVNYSWVIYSNPSVARVAPFIRLPRKKESLAQWAGAKKENKCRTEMVPWGIYKHLIAQTHEVGPYKPVKMTLRNSSRRGRLTRWAIENNIIPYMKSPLKEDWEDILNFSYEIIKSIDKRGEVKTYDMKVQWAEAFTANGFVVHNSQMELRMVAEVSGDEAMIETFKY